MAKIQKPAQRAKKPTTAKPAAGDVTAQPGRIKEDGLERAALLLMLDGINRRPSAGFDLIHRDLYPAKGAT